MTLKFYILLALTLVTLSQIIPPYAAISNSYIRPICTSNARYINIEAYLSRAFTQNQSAVNTSSQFNSCDNIRIDQTITASGQSCKCPLV